jgi:hypothetical protein
MNKIATAEFSLQTSNYCDVGMPVDVRQWEGILVRAVAHENNGSTGDLQWQVFTSAAIDDTRGWTAVGVARDLPATDAVDTYSITSGLYNFIKIVVSGTDTSANSATVTFDWSGKHRSM